MSERSVNMLGLPGMRRFDGQVVAVTGAGGGIGAASARRFASEGATVYVTDVDGDRARSTATAFVNQGWSAHWMVIDVTDADRTRAAFTEIADAHEGIDVVHAHAGILLPAPVGEETLERWQRTMAVNVTGIFLTVQSALPGLMRKRGGAVVLTGSTAGMVAEPDFLAYCTSKAAVNHMTRQLALDLVESGIRVNAVCPGWIDTDFNRDLISGWSDQELSDAVTSTVPMGRQGSADEVAAAVAFLASADASYITGHTLVVDGGITIR
jgi:meso-butanediol dehydrogenase/(S,S)-butanediol dehydrogenase/diacetyl reductase